MKYIPSGVALCVVVAALLVGETLPAVAMQASSTGMRHMHGIAAHSYLGSNNPLNWQWLWDKKKPKKSVPVPGTLVMLGAGLVGFVLWRKRNRK